MSTLREMISSGKELLNAYSDDTILSDEHLAFLYKNKRATYLEILAANPKKQMPAEAYQTLKLKMSPVPECEDGYVILSSQEQLPPVINNDQDVEGIHRIHMESIMAKWINIVGLERIPFIRTGGRFNDKQIYISKTKDDRVIMFGTSNSHIFVEDLEVEIIASDPEEADKLSTENDYDSDGNLICDFYDKKYPIPESMVKAIVIETVNELILKYRQSQDVDNNGSDDNLNQRIPYYGPRRQQQQSADNEG